jgi:poly(3-hydroxybutyrate) depolymerase
MCLIGILMAAAALYAQEWHTTIPLSVLEANEDSVERAFKDDEDYFQDNLEKIAPGKEITVGGLTLPYRLFVPHGYDQTQRYPLVVVLHGAGERGTDNVKNVQYGFGTFTFERNQGRQPMFVVAPQCPSSMQWVNTPWEEGTYSVNQVPISAPLKVVVGLIDELQERYAIDAQRIYIAGVSMGGFGTWDIISRYPTRFAAAVPICGGGDPLQAQVLKDLPIWTFHGDDDEQVPYEGTRVTAQAIHDVGGIVQFTTFAQMGHGIWFGVFRTQAVVDWMLAQRQGGTGVVMPTPHLLQQRSMLQPISPAAAVFTLNGRRPGELNGRQLAPQLLMVPAQATVGGKGGGSGHHGLVVLD